MKTLIHIAKSFAIIIASAIIGLLALILSYSLPTDIIKSNISRGAETLLLQSPSYTYADGYKSAILDNGTDAVILGTVSYDSTNAIQDALNAPRYYYPGSEADLYSLMGYLNGDPTSEAVTLTYSRYWHGYNIILKPFLTFFDYRDLKITNQAIQFILIVVMILLMTRQKLTSYLWGFIMMIIFWNPATMGVSLQYSPCFYISVIAGIVLLMCPNFFTNSDSALFLFLITGILTAYFDFLTYPLVTFGVPFIIYTLIKRNSDTATPVTSILTVINTGLHWAFGYVLMWASKWLLATLITGINVFQDASAKISERSSTVTEAGRLQAMFSITVTSIVKWPYVIMFTITALINICRFVRIKKDNPFAVNISVLIPLLITGLLPFAWFIVASNHSYIHPRLVYRILGITIFAWYSAIITLLKLETDKN